MTAPLSLRMPLQWVTTGAGNQTDKQIIGNYPYTDVVSCVAIGPRSAASEVIVDSPDGSFTVAVGAPIGPLRGPLSFRTVYPINWLSVGGFPGHNLKTDIPICEVLVWRDCPPEFGVPHKRAGIRVQSIRARSGTEDFDTDAILTATATDWNDVIAIPTMGRRRTRFVVSLPVNTRAATPNVDSTLLRFSVWAFCTARQPTGIETFGYVAPADVERGAVDVIPRRLVLDNSGATPAYELAFPTADATRYRDTLNGTTVNQADSLLTSTTRLSITIVDEPADVLVLAVRPTDASLAAADYTLEAFALTED